MNYNSQMKAWAVDRALETLKISKETPTPEIVIEAAIKYCEFTHDAVAAEEEAKILADRKAEESEMERMKSEAVGAA